MMPTVTTSQLPALVLTMARSGLPLMIYSAPGCGKTSLIQDMGRHQALLDWSSEQAKRPIAHLPVVTISAPELNVEDLLGVPFVETLTRELQSGASQAYRVTRWALPALFDPTHPFVLFIDEPNRAEPSVRNALFQLVTGKTTTSGFELPAGSMVVMAGNRLKDKAGVRTLDTAFNNRCAHYELQVDPEAWLDWALAQEGFSALVRSFIARHPSQLLRFDPASPHPQQATPRTWAALGKALDSAPKDLQEDLPIGLVGPESGQLFRAFMAHSDAIPSLEQVLKNPQGHPIPGARDIDKAWILAVGLSDFLCPQVAQPRSGVGQATDDAIGKAVGIVMGRLGEAGFEEVVTFSQLRAWRVLTEGKDFTRQLPHTRRFLAAARELSQNPAFSRFAEAMRDSGAHRSLQNNPELGDIMRNFGVA